MSNKARLCAPIISFRFLDQDSDYPLFDSAVEIQRIKSLAVAQRLSVQFWKIDWTHSIDTIFSSMVIAKYA